VLTIANLAMHCVSLVAPRIHRCSLAPRWITLSDSSAMKTLFAVSADLSTESVSCRSGPTRDYTSIAHRLQADVLDWSRTRSVPAARSLARTVGLPTAQARIAARHCRRYDAILTDGEHIGIPLTLLLKLTGTPTAHVTIGHRLTTAKKRPFFRGLKVHSHIDAVVVHSRCQYDRALATLGFRREQLALLPYQVDADFWHPMPTAEERLIVSAGLEHRDYPTLFRAVAGLDATVLVAAASAWSTCRNTALDAPRPANVEVRGFDHRGLREQMSRAAVVVVPVEDVDFQAGITTILEAMAMGKPVVVTHTDGQTDVVEDRRAADAGHDGSAASGQPAAQAGRRGGHPDRAQWLLRTAPRSRCPPPSPGLSARPPGGPGTARCSRPLGGGTVANGPAVR
jgi:glycosyltransferase involved in cell wall biosynthesis